MQRDICRLPQDTSNNLTISKAADRILPGTSPWENRMFSTLYKLLKNESGATAIEYGLIAALIAVAAVTVMGTVGTNLSSTFNTVANQL